MTAGESALSSDEGDGSVLPLGFLAVAWVFTFLTFPGWAVVDMIGGGLGEAGSTVLVVIVVDIVLLLGSAGMLWKDVQRAADTGSLTLNPVAAFAVIYLAYPVSIPFYVGYRLYKLYL